MKSVFIIWIVFNSLLFALSGETVFAKKCASCHQYYIPQNEIIANAKNNNADLNLTAPTLTEISFMLKDQVGDRTLDPEGQKFQIEEWLTDYLDDPTKEKGVIPDEFTRFFKPMPSMKGKLSEEEIEALTDFIYGYSEKMTVEHSVERHSYEEAAKIAKARKKIIIIEGFIPFCRGCIRMDREVMVEKRVKEALDKDFVFVKKNLLTEKLPLGIKRLGTPSFYFIDSEGKKVLEMVQGFGTADEFLELLASMKEKVRK
jgi:thioredoxin-related protein